MKKRIKLNYNPNTDAHDDEQGADATGKQDDDSIENIFENLFQY